MNAGASPALKIWQRYWPSVTLRVLGAVTVLLLVFWMFLASAVLNHANGNPDYVDHGNRRRALLHFTEVLGDRPELLLSTVRSFDRFMRDYDITNEPDPDDPLVRKTIQLFKDGRLVFASPRLPAEINSEPAIGVASTLRTSPENQWWQVCETAKATGFTACVVVPKRSMFDTWAYFLTAGYLVGPVLFTVPFMAVPLLLGLAWGLRPIKRLQKILDRPDGLHASSIEVASIPIEVRPLARTLMDWREAHQQSSKRERDFIANASHELRTPLAAIRVNAQGLQLQAIPDSATGQLQALLSGERRMSRVVEQLMTMLRNDHYQSLKRQVTPHRFDEIVQARLAELSALADRKQIDLSLQAAEQCSVMAHQEVLESIIDNLVGNAIKYAPVGTAITVNLTSSAGAVALTIRDHGPGIPPNLRALVLERFWRGGKQHAWGVGLGLSIVHEGVLALGGSLRLLSPDDGPGLLVEATLPVSPCKDVGAV